MTQYLLEQLSDPRVSPASRWRVKYPSSAHRVDRVETVYIAHIDWVYLGVSAPIGMGVPPVFAKLGALDESTEEVLEIRRDVFVGQEGEARH